MIGEYTTTGYFRFPVAARSPFRAISVSRRVFGSSHRRGFVRGERVGWSDSKRGRLNVKDERYSRISGASRPDLIQEIQCF